MSGFIHLTLKIVFVSDTVPLCSVTYNRITRDTPVTLSFKVTIKSGCTKAKK